MGVHREESEDESEGDDKGRGTQGLDVAVQDPGSGPADIGEPETMQQDPLAP
jgi:hypothetical protein